MGLMIIKNDAKEMTKGEEKVLNKIRTLYKEIGYEVYLYIHPTIGKLVPDFLLIDAHRGLAIIEVKDWDKSYIKEINKRKVQLVDREDENPVYKTQKYRDITKGIICCEEKYIEGIEDSIFANTVLINLTCKDLEDSRLKIALNQPPIKYFVSEEFSRWKINQIFSEEEINLSEQDIAGLRATFFPESKINKPVRCINMKSVEGTVAILDEEQENFAKKLPYGHYMVTGIPGSGKTVILIARAVHIVKEHPEWKVVILAYNNALVNKIEGTLNKIAKEFGENQFLCDVALHHIEVKTFHKMAMEFANTKDVRNKDDEFWNTILPNEALSKAYPIYDAVLIDEYQDFRDDWIRLCIAICKKHSYKKGGIETEGINLFMAGDRLQSIYNKKVHNWADFGISMRGRSKLLKTTYRAGKTSIDLALQFLQQSDKLEEEVKKFYKEADEKEVEINNIEGKDTVLFEEGNSDKVVGNVLERLIYKEHYKFNEILIVCPTWRYCKNIMSEVSYDISGHMAEVKGDAKQITSNKIMMSTYYSSKGLEAKVAILMGVDTFRMKENGQEDMLQRKLLYVGMTRAAEVLIIHADDFEVPSLAKEIKELKQNL